jgi:GT2 family glycosyltransferase
MEISVIIPHYPLEDADKLLERCVKSLKGYDELIVVVNEGTGYGPAVNTGLRIAKGNYIAVVNNDIYFNKGTLCGLCDPNKVMSPMWGYDNGPGTAIEFLSNCFVMPRWVYDRFGGFDEQFKIGDYEDNDFYEKCVKEGVKFGYSTRVKIIGEQGYTKSRMKYRPDKNRAKFIKKWGKEPKQFEEVYYYDT